MALVLLTAPSVEPVTLDEVKAQCRVNHDAEDDLIEAYITAARQWAEEYCERSFVETAWHYELEAFPSGRLYLPRPRLRTITAFTYSNAAGVTTNMVEDDDYQFNTSAEPAYLTPAISGFWPTTQAGNITPIAITYKSGYGTTAATVPRAIRQAIQLLAAEWYRHREPITAGSHQAIPHTVESLLNFHKVWQVA